MGKAFLSRHFIAERGTAFASVPFAPAATDEQGALLAHNVLAVGSWSEDTEEHRLSIFDVAVRYNGSEAATPAINKLACFQHPGTVTAAKAVDMGEGSVMLVTASDEGRLCRLRMQVPTAPGSSPAGIQLKGEDLDGPFLSPCVEAHSCSITGMDVHADTKAIASTGADGTICISHMGATCTSDTLYNSHGNVMFTAAKWASSHAIYTASLQGAVQAWDSRQAGKPTLTLGERSNGSTAPPATALAVNAAQPFLCAAGYANGSIAIWDTRSAAKAVEARVIGNPTGMQFVAGDGSLYRQAQLLFCTSKGCVSLMDTATGAVREVYQEPFAVMQDVVASAVGAVSQVFTLTDQEGIVFMANAL